MMLPQAIGGGRPIGRSSCMCTAAAQAGRTASIANLEFAGTKPLLGGRCEPFAGSAGVPGRDCSAGGELSHCTGAERTHLVARRCTALQLHEIDVAKRTHCAPDAGGVHTV